MMITAVLIDDEASGCEALAMAIEQYCPEVGIKGIYTSAKDALQHVHRIHPDLIFLDVQMPTMSGFDFLQQASPIDFEVIFVSAYDKYAIQAIKFSALDYLLKPVDVVELVHAVNRVKEKKNMNGNSFQYQSVLNNVQLRSGGIIDLPYLLSMALTFITHKTLCIARLMEAILSLF